MKKYILITLIIFSIISLLFIYKNDSLNFYKPKPTNINRSNTKAESKDTNTLTNNNNQLPPLDFPLKTPSNLPDIEPIFSNIENLKSQYPFAVPSTGIATFKGGLYQGKDYGFYHLGIDIHTTAKNGGKMPNHKGNPVYSACNGTVISLDKKMGGIKIKCDLIDKSYKVPYFDVFTEYLHFGNNVSKETFYVVKVNQKVKMGDYLGDQGDLSRNFPQSRNVHLHFGVTANVKGEPKVNPCLYRKCLG